MQNTYQENWAERSLFYNCRMFTEGLKTGQSYSSKFQFHVIELSKIETTKESKNFTDGEINFS
ncbi:PD-(D/E)XK nuclease family transposase [Anaerostipes hadrus]|uniref:PD-(D/E)XK nuclease family transposase n=1 Tax=Anaerostipes hadrus TaxID=649756 RepID=UPI0015D35ECF